MHERAAAFSERARERFGFEPEVEEFNEGTKTAADAADAIGCAVAQIASSLVFDVDGSLVVSVTSGANRVSEEALGDTFDVSADDVSMADPDRISEEVGWSIGGVPVLSRSIDSGARRRDVARVRDRLGSRWNAGSGLPDRSRDADDVRGR